MEIDDISLGPVFPEEGKYTKSQLITFSRNISRLQFEFAEEEKPESKEEIERLRNVLFDNSVTRAQLLINTNNPSKKLLLRLLQRFLSCLERYDVIADYEEWFIVKPSLPQPPAEKSRPKPRFDPNKPSTSKENF